LTFEFALIRNVLDPSKDLPPFVSYRFDILQAGFRDTGKFVDPSTGVGHKAIKASLVQGSILRVRLDRRAARRSSFYRSIPITSKPRLLAAVASRESWVNNKSTFSISRIESAVAK
jgi:hypothetical protein